MPSKYWIKLYIETIADRKVAKLSTHLRWRMIECFLLAGDFNKNGQLPPADEAAWILRCDEKELINDWNDLINAGILAMDPATVLDGELPDHYWVVNYVKRQAASTSTERWQEWQKRQHSKQYSNDGQANNKRKSNDALDTQTKGYDEINPPHIGVKRKSNESLSESDIDIDINTESEEEEEGASATSDFIFDPVRILCDASGLSDFPADQREWVGVIQSLVDDHGIEKTTNAMKRACNAWVIAKTKNGRSYRKTNLNWINWAQEELAGGELPTQEKKKLTAEEQIKQLAAKMGGRSDL